MSAPTMDLAAALSTLAQVSGTLAALIGFLGLWKLDGLEREDGRVEHELRQLMPRHRQVGDSGLWTLPRHTILQFAKDVLAGDIDRENMHFDSVLIAARPRIKSKVDRLEQTLPDDQQWLKRGLVAFLGVALVMLAGAFMAMPYAAGFHDSAWVPRAIVAASIVLVMGTAHMVAEAAGRLRTYRRVALVLTGILGTVLMVWVLTGLFVTGLFGAVAQGPRVEEG